MQCTDEGRSVNGKEQEKGPQPHLKTNRPFDYHHFVAAMLSKNDIESIILHYMKSD